MSSIKTGKWTAAVFGIAIGIAISVMAYYLGGFHRQVQNVNVSRNPDLSIKIDIDNSAFVVTYDIVDDNRTLKVESNGFDNRYWRFTVPHREESAWVMSNYDVPDNGAQYITIDNDADGFPDVYGIDVDGVAGKRKEIPAVVP